MNKSKEIEQEFSTWAEDYGKIKYSFWEGDLSKQHLKAQSEAIRLLRPKKGDNVLDVGCGVGWGSIKLSAKIEPGIAYGIDITKEMIKKSKEHSKKLKIKNVRFQKVSVLNLPFKDNFFDGAITTHVAHHFYKPVKMFGEIKRVLRPNSRFIIVDTCASSKLIQDFEKKLKKEEKAHHKFFKLCEVKALLKKGGFTKIRGYRRKHTMYISVVV
ncbi:MAG: class I SAM-dependent methyltransferase [Nanoarchaeota archaeon]|nr:class I SAM-dependent methyltransferase [Nanoarchaeota archaeon]